MSKALSDIAKLALHLATTRPITGADWFDLLASGANASTPTSLVKAGYLLRQDYPDGSKVWFITADGRRAIAQK